MFKAINLLFVTTVMFAIWAGPGLAFQLFRGEQSSQNKGDIGLSYKAKNGLPGQRSIPLELGDGGSIKASESEGMNIWIPGLGVVGQMPRLDFGLEMLYGASDARVDAPRTARELDEFETDFAIKGTIKRKF